jgi:hypothetical protein
MQRFEAELEAARYTEGTIWNYRIRLDIFLRWLTGDYKPTGPR